jgi:glucosamine--fructose-6-phosphate aminotransferase (isomerizing)
MNLYKPNQTFSADVAYAIEHSLQLPRLRSVVGECVAAAVLDERIVQSQRILIGGSGDSLFAALSAAPAFRRWTGLLTEAKTAIELARYETALLTPRDLVISVSNSGSSSRAREIVLLAKDRGAPTLALTGSISGAFARQADRVVHRPVDEVPDLPAHYGRCFLNLTEYLAALYALYAFALALGVKHQRISAATETAQLAKIERAIMAHADIAARIEPGIMALAEKLDDIDTIWAIGAGPSRGTAQYSAAKFHEQMPINGIGGDLEEWAHLEYFLTLKWGRRSVVMVIAPPGNSLDRAQEMVRGIGDAGGRAIVVAQDAGTPFSSAFARVDLGYDMEEWLSPLIYHLPAQLLVLHMAARAGIDHIPRRRLDDRWLIAKGIVLDTAKTLS